MKRYLSCVVAALACAQFAFGDIITVDNNPGSVAMYSNLQTAYDAASPGDTILIAGSPNFYTDLSVYKEIHFVGVGYELGTNGVPGLSSNFSFTHLRFKKDNLLGDGSNSTATGITGYISSATGVNGIMVDKCYGWQWNYDFQGEATVTRSLTNTVIFYTTNSSVANCIMAGIDMRAANATVTNCVIRTSVSAVTNTSITNTILLITTSIDPDPAYTYCMNVGASLLPEGNGNVNGKLLAEVFAAIGTNIQDRYYQLSDGSAAIDAGFGGVDMGAYDGASPYVLSGVPGFPRMTRFDAPITATGLEDVTIEVEAEAFAE